MCSVARQVIRIVKGITVLHKIDSNYTCAGTGTCGSRGDGDLGFKFERLAFFSSHRMS